MALPTSTRKPGVYTSEDTSNALRGAVSLPIQVLLIGQKTAAGTVDALEPTSITNSDQGRTYFGAGSVLARMVTAALNANSSVNLSAIALDDAEAGAAAGGAITVTVNTAPTTSGTCLVQVGPDLIEVAVEPGDDAEDIAGAIVEAMSQAKRPDLPVTAAVDGVILSKVVLTAKNKGTLGNTIKIAVSFVNVDAAAAITAMAAGATDPDVQTALDKVFASRYQVIVGALNDATSLGKLRSHLETLAGPIEQRPALGVFGHTGTTTAAITLSAALNTGRLTGALLRETRSLSHEVGAAYGAVIASEEDPAAPLNGYRLKGLLAPGLSDYLSRTEQETLLYGGVTPLEVLPGGEVAIVRAISTYTVNASGTPDPTLLDVTTLRTLDDLRAQWRARMERVFGAGAPASNRKLLAKNLERVRAETLYVLRLLEGLERLRNVDQYEDQVTVTESSSAVGRVDVEVPSPVVPGLHILSATFNLQL